MRAVGLQQLPPCSATMQPAQGGGGRVKCSTVNACMLNTREKPALEPGGGEGAM